MLLATACRLEAEDHSSSLHSMLQCLASPAWLAAADNVLTGCPVYLNSLRCSAGSHAATAVLAAKARLPSGVTASAAKGCCPASNRLTTLPLSGSSRTTCLSAPAVYNAPAVSAHATAATPLLGTPPHQASGSSLQVRSLRTTLCQLCLFRPNRSSQSMLMNADPSLMAVARHSSLPLVALWALTSPVAVPRTIS